MNNQTILINNLRNGKEEGLKATYRLYKRPLLYFSLQFVDRETAEEIVADTFIKVWTLKEKFDNIDRLKAFLYISTKNACLNYLRSPHTKRTVEPLEDWENIVQEDAEIYTKIIKTELLQQIYHEVAKLPHKQGEVFKMTYLEDMTVEEISEKLKISPTAVYINRSRALAYLRSSIKLKDSLYLLLFLQHFFY